MGALDEIYPHTAEKRKVRDFIRGGDNTDGDSEKWDGALPYLRNTNVQQHGNISYEINTGGSTITKTRWGRLGTVITLGAATSFLCNYEFKYRKAGYIVEDDNIGHVNANYQISKGKFSQGSAAQKQSAYYRRWFYPTIQKMYTTPEIRGYESLQRGHILKGQFASHANVLAATNVRNSPNFRLRSLSLLGEYRVLAGSVTPEVGSVTTITQRILDCIFLFARISIIRGAGTENYTTLNKTVYGGCQPLVTVGATPTARTRNIVSADIFNQTTKLDLTITIEQALGTDAFQMALMNAIKRNLAPDSEISIITSSTIAATDFIFSNFKFETTFFD